MEKNKDAVKEYLEKDGYKKLENIKKCMICDFIEKTIKNTFVQEKSFREDCLTLSLDIIVESVKILFNAEINFKEEKKDGEFIYNAYYNGENLFTFGGEIEKPKKDLFELFKEIALDKSEEIQEFKKNLTPQEKEEFNNLKKKFLKTIKESINELEERL